MPVTLAFRERNSGAAGSVFVYLHGAASDKTFWLSLSRLVAERFPNHPGILLDLPGHGESPGKALNSIAAYAEAVEDFLNDNDLKKVFLVGHSMGGAIAQTVAARNPDKAQGLVLVSTGARLGVNPMILQLFGNDLPTAVSLLRQTAFGPSAPEAIAAEVEKRMLTIDPQNAVRDFSACDAFDGRAQLAAIRCPALVAVGEHDQLTPTKLNRRLAESLNADYREIPEAGHMLPLEAPEILAEAIADFVTDRS